MTLLHRRGERALACLASHADMLFRWGDWIRSVEVQKLSYVSHTETRPCVRVQVCKDTSMRVCNLYPPFTSQARCHQCGVACGHVLCRECHGWPLKCSVCGLALHRFGAFCIECGHGGHLAHMTEWFRQSVRWAVGGGLLMVTLV